MLFLYIGVISAVLHCFGTSPVFRLLLKRIVRGGVITSAISLSTCACIPSGPGALSVFRACSFLRTCSSEIARLVPNRGHSCGEIFCPYTSGVLNLQLPIMASSVV